MHYLLIDFKYISTDFYGDHERTEHETRLYFYNTVEECKIQFENIKKKLLKEYNAIGEEAYRTGGQYFVELDEYDINNTIDIVKESTDYKTDHEIEQIRNLIIAGEESKKQQQIKWLEDNLKFPVKDTNYTIYRIQCNKCTHEWSLYGNYLSYSFTVDKIDTRIGNITVYKL